MNINSNDTKIYFVDDVLTSGSAFFAVNSFLRRTANKKIEFETCFFFINRTGYYEYKDIINVLGENKIYSFANLHFPYINSTNGQCPLCDEYDKYQKLYDNSFLTRIKLHFLKEKKKLGLANIYSKSKFDENGKICRRVEAIHRIYELFSEKRDATFQRELGKLFKTDFKTWVKFLMDHTRNPFIVTDFEKKNSPLMGTHSLKIGDLPKKDNLLTETEISVLKCLTQSPFYNYNEIRKYIFHWILNLLEEKVIQINGTIDNCNKISKNSLNELKLLIRRATLLSSNYIVSYKLLHIFKKLYNTVIVDDKTQRDITESSLREFSVFFVAQMNELLYRDEARSEELNARFEYFENLPNNSKFFKQLIRMLLEENAARIRVFAEVLEKSFFEKDKNGKVNIITKITDKNFEKHYNHLKSYQSSIDDGNMKKFLKLRLEIKAAEVSEEDDQGVDDIKPITEKIKTLSEFIDTPQGGCFAIVKYKKSERNPYYLLYNEGKGKKYIEQNEDSFLDSDSFLMMFLSKGENLSSGMKSISIIEFHKDTAGNWIDLFANENAKYLNNFPIPENCNRLLLLRIDRDNLKPEKETNFKGQTVIGFYFKIDDTNLKLTNIERIRYLLLLRGDMSKYLGKVVERNDTFRDFVEKENKIKETLTSDHDFNSIVDRLKGFSQNDDFLYLHSLIAESEPIERIIAMGKIDKEAESGIREKKVDVIKEIEQAYNVPFNYKVCDKLNKDNIIRGVPNLTIDFPRFVFRAIIYEYFKNANSHLHKISDKPFFEINVTGDDNCVEIIIKNNAKDYTDSGYESLVPYEKQLEKEGYKEKGKKGLYKNYKLLIAAKCPPPSVVFYPPSDNNNTFEFVVRFTIKKYVYGKN